MSRLSAFIRNPPQSVRKRLPSWLLGWCALRLASPKRSSELPFNGQVEREKLMRDLIARYEPERIVETGTYFGDTADWFAAFGLPVVSAEIAPYRASFAKSRLADRPKVHVFNSASIEMLTKLASEPTVGLRTLFYLDAHWEEVLPLRDEVELVIADFPNFVIVIDDFQVPDDPGYGFDDYGPGKRLTLDYIRPVLTSETAIFFPSTPSGLETGASRGSVVIAGDRSISELLEGSPLLRRWPHHDGGTGAEQD